MNFIPSRWLRKNAKCGSFAKKGFPVFVFLPDKTQLFDPISAEGSPKNTPKPMFKT